MGLEFVHAGDRSAGMLHNDEIGARLYLVFMMLVQNYLNTRKKKTKQTDFNWKLEYMWVFFDLN